MNTNETITVTNDDDHWVYLCGNSTMSIGFDSCDEKGVYTEPIDSVWTGLYACLKCGRVIDQDSYKVISQVDDLSSFGVTITQ